MSRYEKIIEEYKRLTGAQHIEKKREEIERLRQVLKINRYAEPHRFTPKYEVLRTLCTSYLADFTESEIKNAEKRWAGSEQ